MESFRNRPIITKDDDPRTLYDALRASMKYGNSGELPTDGHTWVKKAQDAYEALGDGFMLHYGLDNIETSRARVTLHLSPDQLEYAVVCLGLERLGRGESIQAVNEALISIDAIKNA